MPKRAPGADIRAAGGVLWRRRDRSLEVALVHRPRYGDWSLPKGKLEDGETDLAAAVREVGEEVGARVAVSRRLRDTSYPVGGDNKQVAWWVMRHLDGEFVAGREVDDVTWLAPDDARSRMSYKVERRVLGDFTDLPVPDSVVVLVRHAHAGRRSEWSGADRDRPLDDRGHAQAERLVAMLRAFAPDRVLSAEPVRCVQTVAPLAAALDMSLQVDAVFGDHAFAADPDATEQAVLRTARPGSVSVICSQGGAIPGLVDRLSVASGSADTRKAAAWVLSVVDGAVISADYYEDAVS